MNQLTFIDKINVLFKMLFSSPVIIGIFAFSMILMILLFFYSKLNKKIMKFIFIFIYVGLIGFAVVKYGKYFLTSIDSFVTLFMANIYFPIIPVYVVIMLISFIIMIVTLSSKNKHRVVKIINTVFFTVIQMLFALFIYIVESNNIDISSNSNLYSNEQTMTLLELGMGLFLVWIVVLLVIFYLKKADKIFKVKKNDDTNDFDEYINDYNEPSGVTESPSVDTSFNNSVIQTLVPEIAPVQDEIISFDDDLSSDSIMPFVQNDEFNDNFVKSEENISFSDSLSNADMISNSNTNNVNSSNTNSVNIFNNFEFLDVPNSNVERRNEDVEVIDFDL